MQFDSVVFAGGGNRCFWQAGFWSVAAPALNLRPSRVAAVSAGSAVACALFAKTFDYGFRNHLMEVARNRRNMYLQNVMRKQPVFPHGAMYRNAILACVSGDALMRLHQGPDIRVLVSCPPRWATRRMAMFLGAVAVGVDAWDGDRVDFSSGRRIGFNPLYVSVRECSTPEALADLIIASSCIPPLTPQAQRDGICLFDGGLVTNVPIDGITPAGTHTLVLLTRQATHLPSNSGRTYVQPSKPIPVGAWDYTNDAALQATFDLGRRDAEAFCLNRG